MIQTPAELYIKLISDFSLSERILCDLHKPCNKSNGHRCGSVMTYPIIDFDEVKTEYQRGNFLFDIPFLPHQSLLSDKS